MSRLLVLVCALVLGVGAWTFAATRADSHPDVPIQRNRHLGHRDSSVVEAPASVGSSAQRAAEPPAWVLAPPSVALDASPASVASACTAEDVGFGAYDGWDTRLPKGQMLVPENPARDDEGHVRVMFHFHGHEAARKEWVSVVSDAVLVALDLGNGSGAYADEFGDPTRFTTLLQNVEQRLEQRLGSPVTIGHFGLSAWSAGYAAVRAILSGPEHSRVDASILLDGLHASTLETTAGRNELLPFVDFAQRAARGETLMFVSHSSIRTPDYVSTTQATNYLVWQLSGNPVQATQSPSEWEHLRLHQRFDKGAFHALGFYGSSKEDHCAQVTLYRHALREYLLPRWGLTARDAL